MTPANDVPADVSPDNPGSDLARLLVSPSARVGMTKAGTAGTGVHDIRRGLQEAGLRVEIIETHSADEVTRVAAATPPEQIVAPLGGDGTIALAARGAIQSGAALLPLPAGRGNDFVRALELPLDTLAVAHGIRERTQRLVDVGMVGDRPFLGVASIGFDAQANAIANTSRVIKGPLIYTYGGIVAITATKKMHLRLRCDGGEPIDVAAWNVAIGNSGRYGGGLKVCPDALLDDGLLDVVTYEGSSRAHAAAAALLARPGKHLSVPGTRVRRVRTIDVDAEQPAIVYADGDPIGALPITVRVRPKALRLVLPRGLAAR